MDKTIVLPNVSVVIAVYDVEAYIAQCCHSLFAQTLRNIEYIFVDDCSPDKSMDIVQSVLAEYPDRKEQVKIIRHPQNMGVSRTREDGVNAAAGEYIIHCDPDDWVELDMYESLYNKAVAEDADMVLCDLWYHYWDDPQSYYGIEKPNELTSRSVLASCLCAELPRLNSSLWNKLVKSRLYVGIEWPYNVSFCEDTIVCAQFLRSELRISYFDRALYHWRLKDRSLSHRNYTKADADKDLIAISFLHRHLCGSGDTELFKFWQAYVPLFMIETLKTPSRIFSNKEYAKRYRQYRDCIFKNPFISSWKKRLLFCATYNYSLAFTLYKAGRKLKTYLREKRR